MVGGAREKGGNYIYIYISGPFVMEGGNGGDGYWYWGEGDIMKMEMGG